MYTNDTQAPYGMPPSPRNPNWLEVVFIVWTVVLIIYSLVVNLINR